jgi:hypothetical protein
VTHAGFTIPTFEELFKAIEHVVKTAKRNDSPHLDRLTRELGTNKYEWVNAAKRYRRLLFLDRCPRACDVVSAEVKGKLQHFAIDDVFGRVMARVVERKLRNRLQPHLPEESVGLVAGTSLQRTMIGVIRYVHDHREDHVVVGDAAACFETARPKAAIRAFEELGADAWAISWLRRFYTRNRGIVRGLGRGLAWAPWLSAITLLPVFKRVRPLTKAMVWTGDDFLAFVEPKMATMAWNELEQGLRDQGLQPSEKKKYVGAVTGRWSFGGHVFVDGRPAPKRSAIDRLHEKLDGEKSKTGTVNGWAGQYAGTANSKEVEEANNKIREKHGMDLPDLPALMTNIVAAWAPAGASLPGQLAGVYQEDSQVRSAQLGSYFSPPGEIQVGRSSAAIPAAPPPSRGAHASTSPPETLLVHRDPDPLNLRWRPELFPALRPGELMKLALANATDFMLYAEALEDCLDSGRYQQLGFKAPEIFVEHHLGEQLDVVLLMAEVAAVARRFSWGKNADGDDDDPPIGVLRALLRMRSTKQWARDQREVLLGLAAAGLMSVRAVKAAVRQSLRHGGQVVASMTRHERTGQKLQARLDVRLTNGQQHALIGGGAWWLQCPDLFR